MKPAAPFTDIESMVKVTMISIALIAIHLFVALMARPDLANAQNGEATVEKSEAHNPNCAHKTRPSSTVRRNLSASQKSGFEGAAVRNYVASLRSVSSPLQIIEPPREFSEVVDTGKPAIPFLLGELELDDDVLREASYHAIVQITNKRLVSVEEVRKQERNERGTAADRYRQWWAQNSKLSRTQWLCADLSSTDLPTAKVAAVELGVQTDTAAISPLRLALERNDLKFYAAGSLARLGDTNAIPYLVDLYLTHEVESFRRDGICLLFDLTGRTFDFNPADPPANREAAIEKWKEWLRKQHP